MTPAFELAGISVTFGGVAAVTDVSVQAQRGQLVSVVGPNGAGKSTLLAVASGLQRPDTGSIRLDGKSLRAGMPQRFAQAGIRRTFQEARHRPDLSVLDNVTLARHCHARPNVWGEALGGRAQRKQIERQRSIAVDALETVGLTSHRDASASELSWGQLRLMEIARALAGEPTTLLLDEPAAGLVRSAVGDLGALLRRLVEAHDVAVVLVEHNLDLVRDVSDFIYVLDFGRLIASGGDVTGVLHEPHVLDAYTGPPIDANASPAC